MKTRSFKGRTIGLILVLIALSISFSASTVVYAAEPEDRLAKAVKATTCFILARAMREPQDTLAIYVRRVDKFKDNPTIIRTIGYYEGLLDAYGYANASKFGSFEASKLDVATHMYGRFGCTINVRI